MYNLTVPASVTAVRKNIDEAGLNESMMYAAPTGASEATDNNSLDDIIARTLPEAINAVVSAAPAFMLEGLKKTSDNFASMTINGKVVRFTINDEVLRLVALQAFDTDSVVSEILAENSPEGRMQLSPIACGTYDAPRLVQEPGGQGTPTFRYYSLRYDWEEEDEPTPEDDSNSSENEDEEEVSSETTSTSTDDTTPVITRFEYIPICRYKSGSLYHAAAGQAAEYYEVPNDIVDKILYRLTGMVLAIYGENEKANYFNGLSIIG